jgi:predicted nucleic acid-binding protein
MQKIVSNSTPLIHLAKIGQLELLHNFFGNILIPQAVFDECVIEGYEHEDAILIAQAKWLFIESVTNHHLVKLLNADLDKGESEAITLSLEQSADLLLLDDGDARNKAKLYGIQHTGTIGILLRAKKVGKIDSLQTELDKLKDTGVWLNPNLYEKLLQEVGEK